MEDVIPLWTEVALLMNPNCPRPATVLGRFIVTILEVVEASCVEETYPIAPSEDIVDTKREVEINPRDPRPARLLGWFTETILLVVDTKPASRPAVVLGKLLATILEVVEASCVEETYPIAPSEEIVEIKPDVDIYPRVPRPRTVLGSTTFKRLEVVDTKLATSPPTVLGRLLNTIFDVVETSPEVLTYPTDPRPWTVLSIPEVLTMPAVAKPTTEEVSSVGSMKELI
jgi:hypothetical protein